MSSELMPRCTVCWLEVAICRCPDSRTNTNSVFGKMSNKNLKACPFHPLLEKKYDVAVKKNGFQNWNVECECGAMGPDAETPEKAEWLWNLREDL